MGKVGLELLLFQKIESKMLSQLIDLVFQQFVQPPQDQRGYGDYLIHAIVIRTGGSVLPHMCGLCIHPSKWRVDLGGGPEVVTPWDWHGSNQCNLRGFGKKKRQKTSKKKCQKIFWGWCHVISLIWPNHVPLETFGFFPSGPTLPDWCC